MPQKSGNRSGKFTSSKHTAAPGKVQETAVSEADRVHYLRLLTDLRDGMDTEGITFPPTLSNVQRAFIHGQATKFGLVSKSRGKGEARQLTVSKPSIGGGRQGGANGTGGDDSGLPWLTAGAAAEKEIRGHVARFAVTAEEKVGLELGESFSTPMESSGGGGGGGVVQRRGKRGPSSSSSSPWRPDPKRHHAAQAARRAPPSHGQMEAARARLPAHAYREEVVRLVAGHQVVLISGETGCGKTTQVPQFLLDDPEIGPGASIVCTQPRRISAIGVAERIAAERCEPLGKVVGFAVRSESSMSATTQLSFVTPGLLLRRLASDPQLERYTHVIIDEVHEQDKYSEFMLILLRRLLVKVRRTLSSSPSFFFFLLLLSFPLRRTTLAYGFLSVLSQTRGASFNLPLVRPHFLLTFWHSSSFFFLLCLSLSKRTNARTEQRRRPQKRTLASMLHHFHPRSGRSSGSCSCRRRSEPTPSPRILEKAPRV